MITRERLGYAPGGMTDPLLLSQDLDQLNAAIESGASDPNALLEASRECLVEAKRLSIPHIIAQTLIQRARILLADRRCAEAIAVLREAERELGDIRAHDLKARIYTRLAEAYAGRGEWREVSDVCEAGIRIVEEHRYDVSGQRATTLPMPSR